VEMDMTMTMTEDIIEHAMPTGHSVPAKDGVPACHFSTQTVSYLEAVAFMEQHVAAIYADKADELLWFLEHPPLYTAGTSAKPDGLLNANRFPIYQAGRGGEYTYHGPGQRVVYLMLDLRTRGKDVKAFVRNVENWAIAALARLHIHATRHPNHIGIWVEQPAHDNRLDKIGAIGIRLRKWISFHGLAINIAPNLAHFDGIIPCGLDDQHVTSLAALGHQVTLAELDAALLASFTEIFKPL